MMDALKGLEAIFPEQVKQIKAEQKRYAFWLIVAQTSAALLFGIWMNSVLAGCAAWSAMCWVNHLTVRGRL